MRRLVLTALVGTSFSIVACGKSEPASGGGSGGGSGEAPKAVRGADSSEALAKGVVDALVKKDKAAFTASYATVDEALAACPKLKDMAAELKEERTKNDQRALEGFEGCLKDDYSKAKLVSFTGGEEKKADKDCPDVTELKDIEIIVDLGGDQKRTVRLDDPIKFGGRIFLWDRFECDGGGVTVEDAVKPPDPTVAPPAPTEPPVANTAPTDGATGTAACDKFLKAYASCVAAMPAEAQSAAKDGLKQMQDQFAKVTDKAMLETVCNSAYDSAKKGMSTFCPNVFQ